MRLDSGDLAAHAHAVRRLLDDAGLPQVTIFASGNLDEHRVAQLLAEAAPIDGFGVGTALDTSADVPALDAVFKLQAYAGTARRKRSEGKATWPGVKQVTRRFDSDGRLLGDTVQLDGEALAPGSTPLLHAVMRGGRRLAPSPSLDAIRSHCAAQLRSLPDALRRLTPADPPFTAGLSERVKALALELDATSH